jgi:hypothetical protein
MAIKAIRLQNGPDFRAEFLCPRAFHSRHGAERKHSTSEHGHCPEEELESELHGSIIPAFNG